MKIKVKQLFRYQVGAKTLEIQPGIYSVPGDISKELAGKIAKFGSSAIVIEKKAPENKVVKVAENKSAVAAKPVRRRSTRAKSDK